MPALAASGLAGGLAFYGGLAVVGMLCAGWLGRELTSGAALFWIQMPISPARTYLARHLAVTGTALAIAAVQATTVALAVAATGSPPGPRAVLVTIPGVLLACLVYATLIWAVGAWGVVGDGWAGLCLAAALSGLELVARLRPAWLGPAAPLADLIGVPLDDLGFAAGFLSGSGGAPGSLAHILAWLLAWVALGAAGASRLCRRPPSMDRST